MKKIPTQKKTVQARSKLKKVLAYDLGGTKVHVGVVDETGRIIEDERVPVNVEKGADGVIELHGRDSITINSGGEKIFAEEVEAAVKAHPGVYDCVVAGRPSERWGSEVVAIVRIREGYDVDDRVLLEEASRHIAHYKLPKAFVFVADVLRSPSGKADYRWAKQMASDAAR